MLNNAEKLCYSKVSIDKLKDFDSNKWNRDNVTIDDIKDLEAIEEYINDNTSSLEKNLFSDIGEFFNQTE